MENLELIAGKRDLTQDEQGIYDNASRDRNAPAQTGDRANPTPQGTRNTPNPQDLVMAGSAPAPPRLKALPPTHHHP